MSIAGLKYYLSDPSRLFDFAASRGLLNGISDEKYIRMNYRKVFGKEPDLDCPVSFNEKLQWLKLYDRKPVYTELADKYAVRKHIAEMIGEEYLIPLVGGPWKSTSEIDFEALPEQFVLKCTHDSGGLVICRDKSKLDIEKACAKLEKSLKRNYYWMSREWPYKDVPPRVIAERYMEDVSAVNLNVYKIFCFNGVPRIFQTIQNDKTDFESIDYFDTEWNRLELRQNFPNSAVPLPKPKTLPEMLRLAGILSEGHAFLRTDLYEINGRVYFSELTFYSDTGLAAFDPPEWDGLLGSWITLPEKG